MKNFLKQFNHIKDWIKGITKGYIETRDLKSKFLDLTWTLVNIIGTGIIITFIIHYFNSPYWRTLSFGLLSAIIMYYLKWFRKLIVAKSVNEIDKL